MIFFHLADIVEIQTVETLIMFLTYKSMVANQNDVQKKWRQSLRENRHRDSKNENHCIKKKNL